METIKIINKNQLIAERRNSRYALTSVVFDENNNIINGKAIMQVVTNGTCWSSGNAAYEKHWARIEQLRNKARKWYENNNGVILSNSGFANPNDLYTFIDQIRFDITAALLYEPDFSPLLAQVVSSNDFDETMKLNQFHEYGAHFEAVEGQGDPLPLIEPKTGIEDTVSFIIYGVGFVRTLKSLLYDKLFDIQKVNRAIARAFAFSRNERIIQPLVSFTYLGDQLTAANADADTTMDQKRYRTIKSALANMACLPHPQYGNPKKLDITGGVYLVMNSCDVVNYEPILRGRINNATSPEILDPLSPWIRGIIPFNGDVLHVGRKTFTLAGCPQGEAYLIAPNWAWLFIKRSLTVQTGEGRALNLSQRESAWWFDEAEYLTDAYLAVMEIVLPDAPVA